MEDIEKIAELLKKRREIRNAQFKEMERKQTTEYDQLLQILQSIKEERKECIETVNKNMQSLIMHEYSIHKLIHNPEQILGLPISHDYHKQAITFLSDGSDFINKSQNVFRNLNSDNRESNIDSTNLLSGIVNCTSNIESEVYAIESQIATVKALQRNTDVGIMLNCNDEDLEI
ncbi:uncharacterized protein LOC143185713 [Calliopsis andreniformis]|uniref:uncharacterized protein LOC143185713 n=1 Tax=Calliopsis andreniformis TaxID=337506 RepID=UPI003FCCE978